MNLKLKKPRNLRRNITDATVFPTVNSLFTPLLANKYAPKSTNELLGNNNAIKILRNWLAEWQKNKIDMAKNHKKATLIIGSPGIGKTSSIYILCKELGYDIFEVNASDTRGRDSLGDKKRKTIETGSFIEEITKNSDSKNINLKRYRFEKFRLKSMCKISPKCNCRQQDPDHLCHKCNSQCENKLIA